MKIDLAAPFLNGNELSYATDAITTNWISISGGYVARLEKELGDYIGAPNRVTACQNATSGLHLAMHCAGVEPDDEVIVPTMAFIAPVNAIRYCYGHPVFMDCGDDFNIDLDKTEKFLQKECLLKENQLWNKKSGRKIKALVVVHFCGNMPDLEKARTLADHYHLTLIEDSAEALGSFYTKGNLKGTHAGTVGNYAVYSFNSNKSITCGSGGCLVSRNEKMAKHLKYLTTQAKDDPLYYVHDEIGFNYRLSNVQAAIACAQLEQIESFIQNKADNFLHYQKELGKIPGLKVIDFNAKTRPNYWFYCLDIDPEITGITRDQLLEQLIKEGVEVRPFFRPCHFQKPYLKAQTYKIEKAPIFEKRILNLPCGNGLKSEEVDFVIEKIKSAVNG